MSGHYRIGVPGSPARQNKEGEDMKQVGSLHEAWNDVVQELDLYDENAVCRLCLHEAGDHDNCSVGHLERVIDEVEGVGLA